ncbi:unnamed protein product [Adineta ricciae]|uniref:Uncharacterized protein n=1 Tax=Adineta ricciae TaxID=249248 RepID=A0A815PGA9_ADIRI|nr:unnamed protein product [Adineta ricciae]CAF1486860.1 unnamed protein product [Adineta ricciae]
MQNQTMLMIVLIWILASIYYCNGATCTCQCCSGNGCTPPSLGSITISSCGSSGCQSACQSNYPTQCTNGIGSTSYQCSGSDSSSSSSSSGNGDFNWMPPENSFNWDFFKNQVRAKRLKDRKQI